MTLRSPVSLNVSFGSSTHHLWLYDCFCLGYPLLYLELIASETCIRYRTSNEKLLYLVARVIRRGLSQLTALCSVEIITYVNQVCHFQPGRR